MSGQRQKNYIIDFIFTLSLFGVFAACALLVVVIGANVYRSIVNTQEANAVKRTSLAYVAEKIRQNDEAGSVYIGDVEGAPALVLTGIYGEESYSTYIYKDGDMLKELFIKASVEPTRIAGQMITEVTDFSVEQAAGQLYSISVAGADGDSLQMYINTHSG